MKVKKSANSLVRPSDTRLFSKERERMLLLEKEEKQLEKELDFVRKEKEKLTNSQVKEASSWSGSKHECSLVKNMNPIDPVVYEYQKRNDKAIDEIFKRRDKQFTQQGPYLFKDGSTYRGGFKNKLRHGFGELISKDGNYFYAGNWENGERKGECVAIDFCGRVYINEDKDGFIDKANNFNGKGVYSWPDGQKFVGSF